MKFLLIVLTVHFVAEVINGKKTKQENAKDEKDMAVRHPAEFTLRYQ